SLLSFRRFDGVASKPRSFRPEAFFVSASTNYHRAPATNDVEEGRHRPSRNGMGSTGEYACPPLGDVVFRGARSRCARERLPRKAAGPDGARRKRGTVRANTARTLAARPL